MRGKLRTDFLNLKFSFTLPCLNQIKLIGFLSKRAFFIDFADFLENFNL